MNDDSSIKITTWNVRGLGILSKLKPVMTRLKHLKSALIFLQESHRMTCDLLKVKRRCRGQVYSASFSTNARGVITLIHKSLPFQVTKTLSNPAGRYLILQGSLFNENITLVNLYGPNVDCPTFFENLFLLLASIPGELLVGGDFNCTISPHLDRSSGTDSVHTQTRKTLQYFMKELHLCDPWRRLFPDKREYSCCANVSKGYLRIDYFLVSNNLFPRITDCVYDSFVISDHGPASLIYNDPKLVRGAPGWRLHPKWLNDPSFLKFVETQIDYYFDNNKGDTSASTRWEAFKAYIRGQIISYTSSITKKTNLETLTFEKSIKQLEREIDKTDLHTQELVTLRARYNALSASKAENSLIRLKQTFFRTRGEKRKTFRLAIKKAGYRKSHQDYPITKR